MLRSLAWLREPAALKSFSPAQPSGRTGSGSAISTFAIVLNGECLCWLGGETATKEIEIYDTTSAFGEGCTLQRPRVP
jgi:hypothetical protein